MLEFSLAGRRCACFAPQGPMPAGGWPLAVLCGWGLEAMLPTLSENLPPMLLFFSQACGARDFTPWPAPGLREGESFTGEGACYLSFLKESALPWLEKVQGASALRERRALLGYSLGGLFALWAMGQGAGFGTYASLSGSLWYEGAVDYLAGAPLLGRESVYLSLGDREELGGPPRLRAVGEATRRAAVLLEARLPAVRMEWNRGGHGRGLENRWRKALSWTAEKICG